MTTYDTYDLPGDFDGADGWDATRGRYSTAAPISEASVPYPRHGRLWDDTLTGMQRLRRVDFLLGLGLDPSRVPDGARIGYDWATAEYRLQYIGRTGRLIWVRRVWQLPPPGPRQLNPIPESLAALRESYAYPYDRRNLPEPEPAASHRARHEANLAAFRAHLRPQVAAVHQRVFPPDAGRSRPGQYLGADVTIIDDPITPAHGPSPALTAAVNEWFGSMRARGA